MTSGAMNMGVPVKVDRDNVVFDICAETPKSAAREQMCERGEREGGKRDK